MDKFVLDDAQNQLRHSSAELARWKLFQSSKWSAEALAGMNPSNADDVSNADESIVNEDESPLKKRQIQASDRVKFDFQVESSQHAVSPDGIELTGADYDLYLLASSLFDCKEYDRCAYFLGDSKHVGLKFLYLYSRYLLWDKKVTESTEDIMIKDPDIPSMEPYGALNSAEYGSESEIKRTANSVVNRDVDCLLYTSRCV